MNGLTLRRARPTDAEAFAGMMSEPEVAMARLHPNPPQVQRPDDASGQGSTPAGPDAAWPRGSAA